MILQNKIINKNIQQQVNKLSLQSIVGKGYAEYWHCKCRYRVCKGSRASKKSKTTALWIICNMMKYKEANQDTLVIAGKDYGMGSSRDWAAKGANLLGVKVVLAESFERIHRSNLVMMGILPVQFMEGENAESLGLTGQETFSFDLSENPGVHDVITVTASTPEQTKTFKALVRFDADADIRYYKNGGILPMVVRKKLKGA